MTSVMTLWLPLALHPLLVAGEWLSTVIGVVGIGLSVVWGGVLLGALRSGTVRWGALMRRLCEWALPVGFIAAGVMLILAGGDCLGQALDSADLTLQRWIFEWWEGAPVYDGVRHGTEGGKMPEVTVGRTEDACGQPGLVVQGCLR